MLVTQDEGRELSTKMATKPTSHFFRDSIFSFTNSSTFVYLIVLTAYSDRSQKLDEGVFLSLKLSEKSLRISFYKASHSCCARSPAALT